MASEWTDWKKLHDINQETIVSLQTALATANARAEALQFRLDEEVANRKLLDGLQREAKQETYGLHQQLQQANARAEATEKELKELKEKQ